MYTFTATCLIVVVLAKYGPEQVWYMDKIISLKLKIYNLFAKEKFEVDEDVRFEELKLEDRPRKKPYVKIRDRIEFEEY